MTTSIISEKLINFFNGTILSGEVHLKNKENDAVEEEILMKPYTYYKDKLKYSDIPSRIAKIFNYWTQVPEDKFNEVRDCIDKATIGLFFYEDLIHDKETRQGNPSAHIVYGKAHVLNNFYLCGIAFCWLDNANFNKMLKLYSEQVIKNCRLNTIRSHISEKTICPDEKIYFKTAGHRDILMFTSLEINILKELCGKSLLPDYKEFAEKIRVFFVIIDECKRIAQGNPEDISVGHFSLPIIYAIQSSVDGGEILLNIMRQVTKKPDLLNFALSLIKKSGALDCCKKKLYQIRNEILEESRKYGENPLLNEFIGEYLIVPDDFANVTLVIS